MKIIVTGGLGFIGSLFSIAMNRLGNDVVIVDKMSYAALGGERVRGHGISVLIHDLEKPLDIKEYWWAFKGAEIVVHFAAETHVDKSITDPLLYARSNVLGTVNALEMARRLGCKLFHYFSTDEVYGPAPYGVQYKETDPYNCTNPYSASKAGGEQMVMAYHNTYGLNYVITRCMNVIGFGQHPEKFLPLVIKSILEEKKIYIHSDKYRKVPGSRRYIHVEDVCRILDDILTDLRCGYGYFEMNTVYNIPGEEEISNLTLVEMVYEIVLSRKKKLPPLSYELVDYHSNRPGHDLRYDLDGSKLSNVYRRKTMNMFEGRGFYRKLRESVMSYLDSPSWLEYTTFSGTK